MVKKKIIALTGNRADYDLLSYLYKYLNKDKEIDFSLIVTGAHLTAGYENSVLRMKKDGNKILVAIENILNSDRQGSRAKATGLLTSSLSDVLSNNVPDLFIVPGDREEAISAGVVCTYLGIPLMHFFGGDFSTSGHIDNPIRAATSKLASIHMVNIEEHKKRLISFGETEKSIFVVGSPSLDKFKEESKMPKKAVLQKVKATYFNDYAILIYHPPLGKDNGRIGNSSEIKNILKVLDRQKINTFVSYPNTDFGNTEIIKAFESYRGNKNFYFYKNFDRNTFVNIYRNASFQIGNSSAGIYEAPAIPIPVIDIGNRQRARGGSENLIRVKGEIKDIETAIKKVKSDSFKKKIKNMASLFGDGKSSKRAYKIIKGIRNYKDFLLKTNDTI